jgi:glycosyltransferase involved in cell wall biosynthesis
MNILYLHQYFHTPREPGSTRSYWIARELVKNGHNVTMITSDKKGTEPKRENQIDGIKVIYLKELYRQKMSVSQRLKAFLGFVQKSIKETGQYKNIDLVIATSTPLTVGITALYLKKFKNWPFLFEVRDLWPEVPIQLGVFKNPLIKYSMQWFEKKIYQNAEHVIALSPGMRRGILKHVPKEKTSMIPNMSKIDRFWPREKDEALREEMGLKKESFKIIYFGALGLANGALTIINSAKLIKDDSSVKFIFVGGGSQEHKLKKKCQEADLENVRFYGKVPMNAISKIVNFCDVSIVSFLDIPILYTNSPNKFFDSLSAAKPIIVNSAGWTKEIVEKNRCGYYVNPHKPEELVNKIKYLQAHPEVVKEMGQNSRKLAITKYDKSILCKQFADIVNGLPV